ncbi:MAG: alpha/beta fold hydrolase [Acidimicrobiia bacterium]|nr:alpha/beta fold hydrolase [Acidimicrobiia bacterium]
MEHLFHSGRDAIAGHLARPKVARGTWTPAVVLAHGFPTGRDGGRTVSQTFPELADRIATEMGWYALAFTYRGCGDSEGDFSLSGWLEDLRSAAAWVRRLPDVGGVWTVGYGTGGAMAICAAADDPTIRGVAALGAPADFDDWARHPRRLLQHAREQGIVRSSRYPPSFDTWTKDLRSHRAVAAVAALPPRALLVVHGDDDNVVPVFDARVLADAHGSADLRIIDAGGHELRHDPRAVAVLLGWLDRQRNDAQAARDRHPSMDLLR